MKRKRREKDQAKTAINTEKTDERGGREREEGGDVIMQEKCWNAKGGFRWERAGVVVSPEWSLEAKSGGWQRERHGRSK